MESDQKAKVRRQPSLDKPSIMAAALRLVDREGLAALNMRALAQELGVGTMSVYHYVPNKDAVLEGLVEAVLSEIEIPPPESGTWAERAAQMARSLRMVALRHPACVPLLLTRPFSTERALRPCEAAFGALREGGLDTEQALIAFRTTVAYVLGFVMLESAGFFGMLGPDRDPDELLELGMPCLAEIAPHLKGRDREADFNAGLRVVELGTVSALLEGLEGMPNQRSGDH
ncbi:MAG: TetR/AcrR family transcriptional regulator C-terminal domain-containing protein [Actinomycetota bacterium]|nr:TetR/AcrR family transcriptional regulator C-terminal domain-containing protein [Actinomycetota bacterium]